jgi:hypothetical protein
MRNGYRFGGWLVEQGIAGLIRCAQRRFSLEDRAVGANVTSRRAVCQRGETASGQDRAPVRKIRKKVHAKV